MDIFHFSLENWQEFINIWECSQIYHWTFFDVDSNISISFAKDVVVSCL